MGSMSSPDKRRGTGGSSISSSASAHGRSVSAAVASLASSSASTRSSIIAPPPRAALSGASSACPSPGPEDPRNGPAPGSAGLSGGKDLGVGGATIGSSSSSNSSAAQSTAVSAAAAAAHHHHHQHQLRERDVRIAHLERELALMESEFTRELDKLSASESETASFWQAKHSALNQQFLRADTELRLLRAEVDVREAERDELRARWDAARRELRERDDEIRALKDQVRGLKEWVSTSTRADGTAQTSDEVFGEGMAKLGNGLQNWVIVNFRKAKLDLSKASESTLEELGRLVPTFEDLAASSKIHLLQSIVSRILVETIFEAYYIGLSPEQARQLTETETLLASFGSAESINQWRSSTLTILKKDASQKLQPQVATATDSIVSTINSLLDSITESGPSASSGGESSSSSSASRDAGLRALIASSVELSRLLAVQKAVFHVLMPWVLPHQRTPFDVATMEDMGGEDEEALADRDVCCVTFPGVVKSGDENGAHVARYRNVICKARVLCSPE